jgi:hypothetical protein
VGEAVVGSKGRSNCSGTIEGEKPWNFSDKNVNGQVQEHADLIAAIRSGPYVNEGKQVAGSSMCAVLGRMAAYTGREIAWKWATETSKLDLLPPKLEFGPFTPPPIAVPGQTELI